MDYLDPQKKKAHKRRITIGYLLFAIVIMFATTVLVYIANGYDIDRDTGEFIQNGLIFVDSRPSNADVYLNGVKQGGKTDARLVVPGGTYDIGVFKPGYRNWARQLKLDGGSLRRITYPRLIPDTLETTPVVSLRSDPVFSSQSIDTNLFVLSHADAPLNLTIIDTNEPTLSAESLLIPSSIVTQKKSGVIEVQEWAANNQQFLATYTVGEAVEYLLININNPDESINLTTLFGRPDAIVELEDRRTDRFFVYDTKTQSIYNATDNSISLVPFIKEVLAYKNFSTDWTLYVTPHTTDDALVDVYFKRGSDTILIQTMPAGEDYLLDVAKLGNAPIIAVATAQGERTYVYNDPQNFLNNNSDAKKPVASAVLSTVGLREISISSDSSIITAVGTDSYASYEFEADRKYRTTHGDTVVDGSQEIRWADGQHYIFASDGKQVISDFDGSNRYELVSSTPEFGSYFSSNVDILYSVTPHMTNAEGVVTQQAQLNATNLLIPVDR